MTRAQLLAGTLLDGASPLASVGRCDMLGMRPLRIWPWPTLPDSLPPYGGRTGRVYVDGVEQGVITMGGRASGKTERQRQLAGLRSDTIPRVIVPA